jgi:hypothetical protein
MLAVVAVLHKEQVMVLVAQVAEAMERMYLQ